MTDRSETDLSRSGIATRLLSSMGMLAHSVAIQAVATVSVTVALATVPWLPHASAPTPQVVASSPAAGTQTSNAQLSALDPFTLSGIPPLGAFPMEGEAHFTTSLSRPFVALAGVEWRDDAPAATGQQAGAAKRRTATTPGCEDCGTSALLQQASFVLPPPRPADLSDGATLRHAPAVPAQATFDAPAPAVRAANVGWPTLPSMPSLPALPGVGTVSAQIDQTRDILGRTLSVATDSVTGIFKAF